MCRIRINYFFIHAILLCAIITAAAHGQSVRFSLAANALGGAGDTVAIPLTLDPNRRAIGSFGASVEFNSTVLTYTGYTAGPILQINDNWFIDVYHKNSRLGIGAFSLGHLAGPGVAVILKFIVNATAAGGDTAPLSFRRFAATDTNVVALPVEGQAGNFTVKPSITGRIRSTAATSLGGIILTGLSNPITTDKNGYYRASVDLGWSGALTPKNGGYIFEPPSRQYTNVRRDQFDQDYQSTAMITNESFAFPNPFNPNTEPIRIRFALEKPAPASIKILDGHGELVKEFSGVVVSRPDILATIQWDGRNGRGDEVSNGVYFYIIEAPENRRIIGKIGVAR